MSRTRAVVFEDGCLYAAVMPLDEAVTYAKARAHANPGTRVDVFKLTETHTFICRVTVELEEKRSDGGD